MIKFKLIDADYDNIEDYKEYSFDIDFEDGDDFEEWENDNYDEYYEFKDNMECENHDYCGTLDYDGSDDGKGNCHVGYQSCEIKNYPEAIEKWKEFFKSKDKLI